MAETTTSQTIPAKELSYGDGQPGRPGTIKTVTTKTTFWFSRVKEGEIVQLIQKQEADGWKYAGNFPTIRGLRPRHFHTLLFRKD